MTHPKCCCHAKCTGRSLKCFTCHETCKSSAENLANCACQTKRLSTFGHVVKLQNMLESHKVPCTTGNEVKRGLKPKETIFAAVTRSFSAVARRTLANGCDRLPKQKHQANTSPLNPKVKREPVVHIWADPCMQNEFN